MQFQKKKAINLPRSFKSLGDFINFPWNMANFGQNFQKVPLTTLVVKAIKPTFVHAWFNSYVGVVLDLKWKGKGREKDHEVIIGFCIVRDKCSPNVHNQAR